MRMIVLKWGSMEIKVHVAQGRRILFQKLLEECSIETAGAEVNQNAISSFSSC